MWDGRIDLNEAARLTKYNQQHLRRLAREHHIDAVFHGRVWWVTEESLAAYMAAKPQRKPQRKPRAEAGQRREGSKE